MDVRVITGAPRMIRRAGCRHLDVQPGALTMIVPSIRGWIEQM
jgi:hypothetical protein